jgi:hypothetical protein
MIYLELKNIARAEDEGLNERWAGGDDSDAAREHLKNHTIYGKVNGVDYRLTPRERVPRDLKTGDFLVATDDIEEYVRKAEMLADAKLGAGTDGFVSKKHGNFCKYRRISNALPIYEVVFYERDHDSSEPIIHSYYWADSSGLMTGALKSYDFPLPASEDAARELSVKARSSGVVHYHEYKDDGKGEPLAGDRPVLEKTKEFNDWVDARRYYDMNGFASKAVRYRYGEPIETLRRDEKDVVVRDPRDYPEYWAAVLKNKSEGSISDDDAGELAKGYDTSVLRGLASAFDEMLSLGMPAKEIWGLFKAAGLDAVMQRLSSGRLSGVADSYMLLRDDILSGKTSFDDAVSVVLDESTMTRVTGKTMLTEANRQQLLSKSRNARQYKDTSKGRTRYERRMKSKISATVKDYNNIEMDQLFKRDVFEIRIPVMGETDVYEVHIKVDGVINEIHRQVQANKGKLEFKVVLQSLMRAINLGDVYIGCTCPDFRYRMRFWATQGNYVAGGRETRPSDKTNKDDSLGAACKHGLLILNNLDWCIKAASVITNYIKYCQTHLEQAYAEYIFPKIYGIKYDKAVQMNLFYNGFLPQDKATRDEITRRSLQGRDANGKFSQNNQYKFKKSETAKPMEDSHDQLKLSLDSPGKSLTADTSIDDGSERA